MMLRLRFAVHDHARDRAEVEELVRFALEPLRLALTVAVKVQEPSKHLAPTGLAYWSCVPKWAGRAQYAITLRLPDDRNPGVHYGEPRVCYHATDFRKGWNREGGNDRTWDEHMKAWYEKVARLYESGNGKLGRWPIYIVRDWREALVHIAAHEGRHIAQYQNGRSRSEVDCEEYAKRRVDEFSLTPA